ncbi:MAG TPA: hypothetical protein VHO06_22755 [Polyangia bacterium]|nr:hypothetical protein [Polyangia bacterium]
MRTTLDIDAALLDQATNAVREDRLRRKDAAATTRKEVVELGLKALLRQLVSERLADEFEEGLAGTARRRRIRS